MSEWIVIGLLLAALAAALNWGVNYDLKRLAEALDRHLSLQKKRPE